MIRRQKVTGLVIFSGELDPDVEGAVAELQRAGFGVVRMPEKFRPLLYLPRDDFLEVSMWVGLSSDDYEKLTAAERKIVSEMMHEAGAIADRYDAVADSFGPARPGELPFADLFGELVSDDVKLAAEVERVETEMMMGVERAQAWGRLGEP